MKNQIRPQTSVLSFQTIGYALRAILFGALLFALCPMLARGQAVGYRYETSGVGAPAGSCAILPSGYSQVYQDLVTGNLYSCFNAGGVPTLSGTWILAGNVNSPSGSGANSQVTLWNGTNTVTGNSGFTYSGSSTTFDVTVGRTLSLLGTSSDATKTLNINTATVAPGAGDNHYGAYIKYGEGSGNTGSGFYTIQGVYTEVDSATTLTTPTAHPTLYGNQTNVFYSGASPGRADSATGVFAGIQNTGTGTIGDTYAGWFQAEPQSSSVNTNVRGVLADVDYLGTSGGSIAAGLQIRVKNLGTGTISNVYGINIGGAIGSFGNWGNAGTITEADAIYIDASTAIGTTQYAIKSNSTAQSLLSGALTVSGHVTLEGVTSAGATGTNNLVFSNSPTLVAPALGTPASGVATNLTGLPLTTGVTGVLPVANGGTGVATVTGLVSGNGTSNFVGRTITANSASIVVTNGNGAAANPTIDTAQNIQTTGTPQFAQLGIAQAAGACGAKVCITESSNSTNDELIITNTSNGSGAGPTLNLTNDAGHTMNYAVASSGYGGYGAFVANSALWYYAGQIVLMADAGGHNITFATGGNAATAELFASSGLFVGTSPTDPGSGTIQSTSLKATGASVNFPGLGTSSAGTTGTVCWTTGTGLLNVDTTTTCLLSSGKYKQDERPLASGLETIMQLRPVSYSLRPEFNSTGLGEQIGFFAEDVYKVEPRLVSLESDGSPHAVRYQQMNAVIVKGIQEMQVEIERLKAEINQLKGRQP